MAKRETDNTPLATLATTATPSASAWGIPNWRDAAAYGDVKRWEHMRWRWEFYRRRDDLRAAFDASASQTYQDTAAQYPPWPDGSMRPVLQPHEAGFVARLWYRQHEAKRFGYISLPNPRISEQPANVIFSALDFPGDTPMMVGKGPRYPGTPEHEISVGDGEVAVVFDLDKPLGPQLERLKDELTGWQIHRRGKALQKRRHPSKWLAYLRTLDAREDGASWAEIAALHPNTVQTEQTARDIWEAANALRFNF